MTKERQSRRLTEEHKTNISISTTAALASPEMRARLSLTQSRIWTENPQRRNEQSRIQRELWSDPRHRRRMSGAHIGNSNTEETRDKIKKALKGKPSPLRGREMPKEHRAKIGDAQRKNWENPEYRENRQKTREARKNGITQVDEIDTSLWEAAIEENLIDSIIKQNLMTQDEIDKIRRYNENGKKPPEKLMDKFSIAIARVA